MQAVIVTLEQMGKFPAYSDNVTQERIENFESAIKQITSPVTNAEARVLCSLLNEDDFFGLVWTVIHLVETAPGWPIHEAIESTTDAWREVLIERVR